MSNIQRFEPWPQEWPMEDNDGDLVMYDDHMKIVRGLEVKLAKAMIALQAIADDPYADIKEVQENARKVLAELEKKE
jgi:hypothetical protein